MTIRFVVIFQTIALSGAYLAAPASAQNGRVYSQFLDELREAETATMSEIDYEFEVNFQLQVEPQYDDQVTSSQRVTHVVWQGDKYRAQTVEDRVLFKGSSPLFEEIVVFNGTRGRSKNSGVGNEMMFPPESSDLRSLHGFVFDNPEFGAGVTRFLEDPSSAGHALYPEYNDSVMLDGVECRRVSLFNYETIDDRRKILESRRKAFVWDYYFTNEGLLPAALIRSLVGANGQRTTLLSEIKVASWQDVGGRLFPHEIQEKVFQPDGSLRMSRSSRCTVRSLAPSRPDEFFTIEFPPGTRVYELTEPGVVLQNYVVGERRNPPEDHLTALSDAPRARDAFGDSQHSIPRPPNRAAPEDASTGAKFATLVAITAFGILCVGAFLYSVRKKRR